MRQRFRTPELQAMYAKARELGADNFSSFYVATLSSGPRLWGPFPPRTGAGHRCAYWDARRGRRSLYDGSRGGRDTYGYAAWRAGADDRADDLKRKTLRPSQ